MTLGSWTTKVAGSDNSSERKILTTDLNQIKQALQTGDLDIAPRQVLCQGTAVLLSNGSGGIRYNNSTNKTQYSNDGSTYTDMDSAGTELITVTAGETIGTGKLVYIKTSDDKVYMTNSGTATTYDWVAITAEPINTNATGSAYSSGNLVGGFSGLSPGDWYGMSTENGSVIINGNPNVGIAITTNQIKLIKERSGRIRRKQFSDATERTSQTAAWADSGTSFTFTAPVNSMILGLKFSWSTKNSDNTSQIKVNLKFSGSNLGTKYLIHQSYLSDAGSVRHDCLYFSSSEDELTNGKVNTYQVHVGEQMVGLKILDTSTTITVRLYGAASPQTGYIRNVLLDVIYVENYAED